MFCKKMTQRAAMFGMDARIALVAMGVAAAAVGVSSLTQIKEAKIHLAEKRVYDYKKSYLSNMLADGADGSYMPTPADSFSNFASEYGEKTLGQDPWGNNYAVTRVSATKTIDGQSTPVYFFTVYSYGPDGVDDSVTITNEADYISWAPANDDIGIKFSTYDNTRKILAEAQNHLNEIMTRLKIYERKIFETLRTYCDIPSNQLKVNCDFNGNGVYTTDEEFKMNLFPKSTGETLATKYYSGTTYTSGDRTSMHNMLVLIGMDPSFTYNYYAADKLTRILHYTSNATGATEAPFAARVWYE